MSNAFILQTILHDAAASNASSKTYPVSRTLHASKNNDGNFVYYYTIAKVSATGYWQLKKAWRTDANGQVVEEFPVP